MSFQIDIFCCGDIIEENTSTLQNIKEKFYSNDEVGLDNIYILNIQSKLFIMSLVITEYSISDINLLGTDLFPLKFPLYKRIFT